MGEALQALEDRCGSASLAWMRADTAWPDVTMWSKETRCHSNGTRKGPGALHSGRESCLSVCMR